MWRAACPSASKATNKIRTNETAYAWGLGELGSPDIEKISQQHKYSNTRQYGSQHVASDAVAIEESREAEIRPQVEQTDSTKRQPSSGVQSHAGFRVDAIELFNREQIADKHG